MSDTPVIDVRDFRMRFGEQVVIDDLSFEVRPGETFGLLGSNGSGKTTTIRALLGIYTPTAGTLLVEGRRFDPARAACTGAFRPRDVVPAFHRAGRTQNEIIHVGRPRAETTTRHSRRGRFNDHSHAAPQYPAHGRL